MGSPSFDPVDPRITARLPDGCVGRDGDPFLGRCHVSGLKMDGAGTPGARTREHGTHANERGGIAPSPLSPGLRLCQIAPRNTSCAK